MLLDALVGEEERQDGKDKVPFRFGHEDKQNVDEYGLDPNHADARIIVRVEQGEQEEKREEAKRVERHRVVMQEALDVAVDQGREVPENEPQEHARKRVGAVERAGQVHLEIN